MRETIDTITTVARPGIHAFFEDVFGLNVRGLRTLGDLYTRPKRVFDSARVTDWNNHHTPTIRLTFSLLTVYMLLSFFWAAEDGPLYQMLYAQLETLKDANPDLPPVEEMIDGWFAAYSFSYPFIYMLIHLIAGSLVFLWGKGTSWTTRLRLYFGLCAITISVALLSAAPLPLVSVDMIGVYTVGTMLVGMLAYGVTYVRGMKGSLSVRALAWRAPFIAMFITLIDLVIATVTVIGSGMWVDYQSASG
ncbi:MAG: hypothetical protein ACX94B_00410 [Henriciella sp.]